VHHGKKEKLIAALRRALHLLSVPLQYLHFLLFLTTTLEKTTVARTNRYA
jgi:hypothetical protein